MSHYMTALAMRQQGLKPAAKIVLYWLADHHNGETGDCFPSLNLLARECEMSRPTVVKHLGELEKAGLISRSRRERSNGSQTSTAYILNLTPVKNLNSPCKETLQPPVKNLNPHNLGNNNLVTEQLEREAFDLFVSSADIIGCSKPSSFSADRKQKIKARLKEVDGIEGWKIALEKAETSDFIKGRGWFSIDWMLKPQNFTKLMEGNYDNRTNDSGPSGPNGSARRCGTGSGTADAFAAVAARMLTGEG